MGMVTDGLQLVTINFPGVKGEEKPLRGLSLHPPQASAVPEGKSKGSQLSPLRKAGPAGRDLPPEPSP